MYRQFHPRANISIECNTARVPADGKYYVIKDGETLASFRNLKVATACYQKIVDEMALPPLVEQETKVSYEQMMDDYFAHISNNALLGTSFGMKKGKKTGRYHKTK